MTIPLFLGSAWALDPKKHPEQYAHDLWAAQSGITGEGVKEVIRTADGYVWVRTAAGLLRFDGMRFVGIEPVVGGHAVGEPVRAICLSPAGELMARTRSHTLVMRGGRFEDFLPPGNLEDGDILRMFVSRSGEVFVGADDFIYLTNRSGTKMLMRGTGWISSFHEDSSGTVWVGGGQALYAYKDGRLRTIESPSTSRIWAVQSGRSGRLYVGSTKGLFELAGDGRRLTPVAAAAGFGEVRALTNDSEGNLWVGTVHGLMRLSASGAIARFESHQPLTDEEILSLFVDHQGSLWIGTANGLDRLRDALFQTYSTRQGLPASHITNVAAGPDGSVYVFSSGNGMGIIRDRKVTKLTAANGLPSDEVGRFYMDRAGTLWLGNRRGLARYSGGRFDLFTAGGRLSNRMITAVSEDDKSLILTTKDPAAWRFRPGPDGGSLEPLERSPLSAIDRYTFSIGRQAGTAGTAGTLWFATAKGLIPYSPNGPPAPAPVSGIDYGVYFTHRDTRGDIWVCGRRPGLARYSPKTGKVVHFAQDQGLFNDSPSSVLTDLDGNLWIGTPRGIYFARIQELDAVAGGRQQKVHAQIFAIPDGLESAEATVPGSQPSAATTPDGRLWFGTRRGVVSVNPQDGAKKAAAAPRVVIEEASVDGVDFPPRGEVRLEPGSDRIEIKYSAPGLELAEHGHYRYRLLGYDDWHEAPPRRRIVTYTNLPPRFFRFQVQVADEAGHWHREFSELAFSIKPRFYQTGLFGAVTICLVLILIALAAGSHTGRLSRRSAQLERLVSLRTEELRQAKDAAESASRAKSEFLANMSHEIRTPMAGVMGMTDLALNSEGEPQREYLQLARSSADALLVILNDVLDFSKIEAGKITVDPIEFNVRDMAMSLLRAVAPLAHGKGLELTVDIAPDAPGRIEADPVRLRQILGNLVSNAIKFTQTGEVAVAISASDGDAPALHCSVRDTGIGVAPETLARLFQPFEQADTSTTRQYGGTGLGLAICARLTELMGGRIWCDSTPGAGSTFHFTVAYRPAPANGPTQTVAAFEGQPVLIVDDNPTNLRLLSEWTARWGMVPSVASSGPEALETVARAAGPFSLFLIDERMPGMDGFDLIQNLQAHSAWAGGSILMLSSDDQAESAARCRRLGVERYLTKPLAAQELRDVISQCLGTAPAAKPGSISKVESVSVSARSLRILLAEDNRVNQRLASALLARLGHSVSMASTGRQAVEAWERDIFDLILMDVQMPDMDGLEATRAIRAREGPGRHTPIIAVTAHAMSGYREICLQAGMDDHLTKPFSLQSLAEAVERNGMAAVPTQT